MNIKTTANNLDPGVVILCRRCTKMVNVSKGSRCFVEGLCDNCSRILEAVNTMIVLPVKGGEA